MSEAEIIPQEPGEIAGVDQTKLASIAAGTVGDLDEVLSELSETELAQLATIEEAGKNRVSALRAIQDELNDRGGAKTLPADDSGKTPIGDAATYANMRAKDIDPGTLSRPVLTLDGWLLPAPSASAEG